MIREVKETTVISSGRCMISRLLRKAAGRRSPIDVACTCTCTFLPSAAAWEGMTAAAVAAAVAVASAGFAIAGVEAAEEEEAAVMIGRKGASKPAAAAENSRAMDPALASFTWADLERISPVVWRRATRLAREFGYDY